MEENHHGHGDGVLNPPSMRYRKLSLEKYFSVLASGDYDSLIVPELNHILSIHGFKHMKLKKDAKEAVSTLEVWNDLSRSTLGECIRPAPMSLDDVVKDLTQLYWQTCPVVSVKSINSTMVSTCNPKASVDPSDHKSGKQMKKAGPLSTPNSYYTTGDNQKKYGEASTFNPTGHKSGKKKKAGLISKLMSSGQTNRSASSGDDNSDSSLMMEEQATPANKRKRKATALQWWKCSQDEIDTLEEGMMKFS